MNYSDYDSDGYSSNDDVDYVPSEDNLSEDDMNECEKEDPLDDCDDVPRPGAVTKRKKKIKGQDILMRKRMKGGLKLEGEEEEKDGGGGASAEVKKEEPEEEAVGRTTGGGDDRQKKKADDLWASFLSDVGTRPKPSSPDAQSTTTQKADSSVSKSPPACPEAKPPAPSSTVTITKVFDFAGEEVRVTKEVSADSKEAKCFLKSQEEDETREQPSKSLLPGPSAKRPTGMSGILGRLGGKKQKMSTLEKSKMDWDAFKSEEGITDELAIHNRGKEGYVERKNFLERVDHRQFELEKAVRLTNMKPR